jgi:hypothetical protein
MVKGFKHFLKKIKISEFFEKIILKINVIQDVTSAQKSPST